MLSKLVRFVEPLSPMLKPLIPPVVLVAGGPAPSQVQPVSVTKPSAPFVSAVAGSVHSNSVPELVLR